MNVFWNITFKGTPVGGRRVGGEVKIRTPFRARYIQRGYMRYSEESIHGSLLTNFHFTLLLNIDFD